MRSVWDREVGGSNPLAPTILQVTFLPKDSFLKSAGKAELRLRAKVVNVKSDRIAKNPVEMRVFLKTLPLECDI